MTQWRPYAVFFGLVLGVALLGYTVGRPRRTPDIVDAVPPGAWLVVTVDVASIRSSPFAQPLVSAGPEASLPGLGLLSEACGFDPLSRVKQLLVTSPEEGPRSDFGVAFTGDFTRDELARCAQKVIRARGGSPTTSAHGAFTTVEDSTDAKHARVAYRDGGPFLVGRGAWLDAMLEAVEGRGNRPGPEHAALRAALDPKHLAPARAVVVTAVLPSSVREKIKAELGAEAGAEEDKSLLAVLDVAQVGLALRTGGAGSTTELAVELRCAGSAACQDVRALVERKRLAFSRELGVRLLGLGPLLDSLQIDARGSSLSATARAPTDDLARAVQRALDYSGMSPKSGRPPLSAGAPPSSSFP